MRTAALAGRLVVLMLMLMGSGLFASVYAAPSAERNIIDRVVIVEDKTLDSGCRFWVDSSTNSLPCESGSVIISRESTYDEVKNLAIKDYVILTNNPKYNAERIRKLAHEVHKARKSQTIPLVPLADGECGTTSYNKRLSYVYSIPTPKSATVFAEVSYTVKPRCQVENIQDRAKSGNSNSIMWKTTYIGQPSNVWITRNIGFLSTTSYTAWQSTGGNNALVGSTYSQTAAVSGTEGYLYVSFQK